jgi:stearoyl-CoA desaturase (delta-9 desaturase)
VTYFKRSTDLSSSTTFNWTAFWFLAVTHLVGLLGWPLWVVFNGAPQWQEISVFVFMYFMAILGINFGYHRCLAHKSFQMNGILKFLSLFGGASTAENSALIWCSTHRRHHRYEDTDQDPYNIKKGFWWAHMGWIFAAPAAENFTNSPDLLKDKMIVHQHRYYVWWLAASCFGLPLALGFLLGRPMECLLLGGFTRLFLVDHFTYFVNSWAHYFGSRPYSTKITARESTVVALVTAGEGYHNFHHRFPFDYRNGHKWFHFDPTKWMVFGFSKLGWTWALKETPASEIYRARIQTQQARLEFTHPRLASLNESIEAAHRRWHLLVMEVESLKQNWDGRFSERMKLLRQKRREAKRDFMRAYEEWQFAISSLQKANI